jgi:hypothetical protein
MRIVRYGLLTAAAIFGLLVAARAIWGPLRFPVAVRTPINIESVCGLCLVLALAIPFGHSPDSRWKQPTTLAGSAALLVLVVVAFRKALETYFLADDFLLVTFANAFQPTTIFHMLTTGGGDGFFRPAGYWSLGLTATWARFDPRLWHATALALHALNAVLVSALASRLGLSRRASWFAGALFAIHGCLPESTVWIAGRFDLLATCFVLSGLLAFAAQWRVLSLAFLVLALLSKEEAYIFPLLAVLLAVSLRIPWRKATPLLSLFLLVTCILFVYRWKLQGGIGGYTDLKSGAPLFGELGSLQAIRSLALRLWAVLFFPINWSRQPGVLLGSVTAAYVAALVWLAANRTGRLALLFPLGTVFLAALPPLHQLLIGPDLQKSRLLYLPLVGFSLLLATAVEPLEPRARWIVPAAILLFQFTALQHNLDAWRRTGEVAKQSCIAAASCLRPGATKVDVWNMPGSLDGVYFLDLGLKECIHMQTPSVAPEVEFHSGDPTAAQDQLIWDETSLGLTCPVERPVKVATTAVKPTFYDHHKPTDTKPATKTASAK